MSSSLQMTNFAKHGLKDSADLETELIDPLGGHHSKNSKGEV